MSSVPSVILGGLKDHLKEIKRCKRLILIGCGTSFHAAVAVSRAMTVMKLLFVWILMMMMMMLKLLLLFPKFSDQTDPRGVDGAACHGGAGERLPGPQHACFQRRCLLLHQPVR